MQISNTELFCSFHHSPCTFFWSLIVIVRHSPLTGVGGKLVPSLFAGEMGGSACVCGGREVFVFMCKGVFMAGVVVVDEVYW